MCFDLLSLIDFDLVRVFRDVDWRIICVGKSVEFESTAKFCRFLVLIYWNKENFTYSEDFALKLVMTRSHNLSLIFGKRIFKHVEL